MQENPLLRNKTLVPGPDSWTHQTKGRILASTDLTGEPHTGSGSSRMGVNLGYYNKFQALDLSIQVMDLGELGIVTANSKYSQGLRHCPLQPSLCVEMILSIAWLSLAWRCSQGPSACH